MTTTIVEQHEHGTVIHDRGQTYLLDHHDKVLRVRIDRKGRAPQFRTIKDERRRNAVLNRAAASGLPRERWGV